MSKKIIDRSILFEILESKWGLKNIKQGKILQQSNDRVVGLIQFGKKKFVYKTAGSWKNLQGVTKDTKIFSILKNVGFKHAPQLLKTKDGKNFIRLGKTFLYVLEYVEGKTPKPLPQTYRKLAVITAQLHTIKGFPFKTDFDAAKITKDLCKNSRKYTFGREYSKIARALPDFKTFPQTVIHTDIAPANSIQKRNGQIVFVDWDDAGIGPTVLDLGAVLNEIIKEDTTFNKRNLRAFFETYLRLRKISSKEKDHIVDGCLFFALMYMVHGDTQKRWKRILWLIEHRKVLQSYFAVPSKIRSKIN